MSAQSEAIEQAVAAILDECGVRFSVALVDENAVDENGWKHAAWNVRFVKPNGALMGYPEFSTQYRMGSGLRELVTNLRMRAISCGIQTGWSLANINWKTPRTVLDQEFRRFCTRPQTPTPAGVLHSLILDASAADSTFDEWCADFGYDSDSRKALATYLSCQETAKDLRRLFGTETLEKLADAVREL